MSKSIKRVELAAQALGLEITIRKMPGTTRTAVDAADACDCTVGQIVKSMIFEGSETGTLKLLLVSGIHDVDLAQATALFGEPLIRADPKRIRTDTGFAIGGVSPIGHLSPIDTWMDVELLNHQIVWAAAGAPDTVFSVISADLQSATNACLFQNK